MAELELRVLWLYPEHMNIYADRGNIAVLERRCAWRGIGFELAGAGPGEALDPDAHDLLLHRRRPGPRPGAGRAATWSRQARRACRGARARRRDARGLRRLPAARALVRAARRRVARRARAGRRAHRARARRAPDRQRRDRGRARRRAARAWPASRTTAVARTWARARRRSGGSSSGFGNNGRDGFEGVRRGTADRHLPARPAAAEEHLVRRPPDRVGARARGSGSRRSSRSTTSWRAGRTSRARCGPALSAAADAARARSSRSRAGRGRSSASVSRLDELERRPRAPSRAGRCDRPARPRTPRADRCSAAAPAPRRGSRRRSGRARSTSAMPCRAASPERGSTSPAWPSGIATAMPVPTLARSPGLERAASAREQVEPASSLVCLRGRRGLRREALEARRSIAAARR